PPHVVDVDPAVRATGGQPPTVGAPVHRPQVGRVARKDGLGRARPQIEDGQRPAPGHGQAAAGGGEPEPPYREPPLLAAPPPPASGSSRMAPSSIHAATDRPSGWKSTSAALARSRAFVPSLRSTTIARLSGNWAPTSCRTGSRGSRLLSTRSGA